MGKKSEDDDVAEMARDLLDNLDDDRQRLTEFFDRLLQVDDVVVIAEQVAKIAEALTRQNHLRIDAIKAKIKSASKVEDDDLETFEDIGRPFEQEEDGSN